jgi:hypothetical protein
MAANEDFRAARNAPDPYVDEPEEEELFDDEQPPKRSSRVLPIVVASLAILGFIVIVYYAYQQGIRAGSEQNPPIIKAEEGPTKIRPASPGGMEVPNQGMKVYELGKPGAQTAAAGPERILPKPEEPLQRPAPAPEPALTQPAAPAPAAGSGVVPTIPGSAAGGTSALPGTLPPLSMITGTPLAGGSVNTPPPPPLPGATQQPSAPAAASDAPPAPSAAKASGLGVPAPPPPAAPPRDNAPAAASPAQRGIALGAPRPSAPGPALQQQAAAPPPTALTPAPAAPAPATAPAPSAQRAVPPIGAAPAGAGGHRVQIVAAKTDAEAQQFWQSAVRKHGDLLGSLNMETQAIDVPGKGTLIRVLVGPFAARPEAEKLCADLKARKQDCLVR